MPRHLFLPGVEPGKSYADEAIPTKWQPDGRAISSSSQPAVMAVMLEQLCVEAGQRVLEIGAGTGYNAALLSHLVGEAGAVTTVDIDEDLVEQASRHLAKPGQERFVAPVVESIAEAYVNPTAWPRVVMDGHEIVGFVMANFDPDNELEAFRAGVWRLNVAADAQGRSAGRFAVEAVADEARRRGVQRITVLWERGKRARRVLSAAGLRADRTAVRRDRRSTRPVIRCRSPMKSALSQSRMGVAFVNESKPRSRASCVNYRGVSPVFSSLLSRWAWNDITCILLGPVPHHPS